MIRYYFLKRSAIGLGNIFAFIIHIETKRKSESGIFHEFYTNLYCAILLLNYENENVVDQLLLKFAFSEPEI